MALAQLWRHTLQVALRPPFRAEDMEGLLGLLDDFPGFGDNFPVEAEKKALRRRFLDLED